MATTHALALRRGQIEARLAAAAERVHAQSAAPPSAPVPSKVSAVAALNRLEWLADLLEAATAGSDPAPVDAMADQLTVTTTIASDLFEQVQEAQADATETGGLAPPHEQSPPVAPAAPGAGAPPAPNPTPGTGPAPRLTGRR